VIMPLRLPIWLSDQKDKLLGLMPGGLSNSPKYFGVKILSIFFNSADSHKGLVVLFEGEDGNQYAFWKPEPLQRYELQLVLE